MSFIPLPKPDQKLIKRRRAIARDLIRLAPGSVIMTDPDSRALYAADAFGGAASPPLLTALPSSTEEVAAIISYCGKNQIAVVARGGGTGLTGGAMPGEDMVAIGLSRMRRIINIDPHNRHARVESGITNLALDAALARHGFFFPPDPASRAACTIGGNIATNAGGPSSFAMGAASQHVTGLTVVLADGEIARLGGDFLDASGYDLIGLLCGSEVSSRSVRVCSPR